MKSGHIHHEHLAKAKFTDKDQVRSARISAVENGYVLPDEAEADRFAAARIGKDAFMGFLAYLLQTRPKGVHFSLNDVGARGLKLRIAAIQGPKRESPLG